jgi:hypothetical protein
LSRWAYDPVSQKGELAEINLTGDLLSYTDRDVNQSRDYSYSIASVNINGVGPAERLFDLMPTSEPDPLFILGAILAGIWIMVAAIVIWERRKGRPGGQN